MKKLDQVKSILQSYYFILLGLALAALFYLGQLGPLGFWDLKLIDLAFNLRGTRQAPDNAVILSIDDNTFEKVDAPLALHSGR